jgi:hypothetical protein
MLSLATSRSKKPSAQLPDPNIRLGFGETALRRSLLFAPALGEQSGYDGAAGRLVRDRGESRCS